MPLCVADTLTFWLSTAKHEMLMRRKDACGVACDGEAKHVLCFWTPQPLLHRTWSAVRVQGCGTEPSEQQRHGMAPCSQRARFASITSACKRHINTGAAEELAAIKQSSSLGYLIEKQVVYIPWWTCFMPLPDQPPTTACWCMVLLQRNFQEGLNCWWLKQTLKKISLRLSSLAVSGFKSLRKRISKAWVLMSAFKGFKLTTGW